MLPSIDKYLRLIRFYSPTGTILLLLPCFWSLVLADAAWHFYVLFVIGAFLMRSAGCIINDMVDIEIDAKVERTRFRPLASGEISLVNAWISLVLLLVLSLLILVQMNHISIIMGVFSLGLVAIYPLMKRITYFPQIFLGVAFNFGVIIAWVAAKPEFSITPILLYLSAILWTVSYDTIYAHQDKNDDILIGVKSTAIKFGNQSKKIITILDLVNITLLFIISYLQQLNIAAYIILFTAFASMIYQIAKLDINSPEDCFNKFKLSIYTGTLILMAFLLGKI